MGLGDEIMVTALAKKNRRETLHPSIIIGKNGKHRTHLVWNNNPNIVQYTNNSNQLGVDRIKNHSGHRHYIDHTQSTPDRWVFKPWDIEPGEIFFSKEEKGYMQGLEFQHHADILVDPGVKAGRGNKAWPLDYWNKLIMMFEEIETDCDVNNPNNTQDIRKWLLELTQYRLIICHEGGLHHAAAALGIPCITLFGGFISPRITGYNDNKFRNLTHATEFCGLINPCQHCRDEMNKIKPEEVFEHVKDLLHVK